MTGHFNAKQFLSTLTNQPGVYRMYNTSGVVIYVGKAKDLKKRLSSYFCSQIAGCKTDILVKNTHHIDVTITHTETEALILEHNYIKLHQPRYNVLLRDDKSYPFIFLSSSAHPYITSHRGTKRAKGNYFGPFPNSYAVKETLAILQKLFPIRQCKDSVYRNRSRPCLQYQIDRCLGPCVTGLVSDKEYQQQVEYVRLFLSGKDRQVLNQLVEQMDLASQALNFEEAARVRDQIQAVRCVIEKQFVSGNRKDLDAIGVFVYAGIVCIHVLFIRWGKLLGSRSYFPTVPDDTKIAEVIQAFMSQFYLQNSWIYSFPSEILLDLKLPGKKLLAASLSVRMGRKIQIQTHPRGDCARYLKLARTNAEAALKAKLSQRSITDKRLVALAEFLGIQAINRIECFDVSHSMGAQTVASCVVFDGNGPVRAEYRCYNIENITPGDDYAAIDQVLRRRYSKPLESKKIPDLVIIDGGKGHLRIAKKVFQQLEVPWNKSHVILLSLAKRVDRKPGFETLFMQPYGNGIILPPDSPALHVIQHIRDDSHNHAINGHRNKRTKIGNTSTLELVKGVGPKRRQSLLKYMGGLQSLCSATIEEIANVPGISITLAEKIFNALKH